MARLTSETEDFRARQRKVFGEKEVERKENRAREMLMEFDREKGVKVSLTSLSFVPIVHRYHSP